MSACNVGLQGCYRNGYLWEDLTPSLESATGQTLGILKICGLVSCSLKWCTLVNSLSLGRTLTRTRRHLENNKLRHTWSGSCKCSAQYHAVYRSAPHEPAVPGITAFVPPLLLTVYSSCSYQINKNHAITFWLMVGAWWKWWL